MANYAVLGSTGNCGTTLIHNLMQSTQHNIIHASCRNESKLSRPLLEQESFTSYLDLAAGMIEAAGDEDGRYCGRNLGRCCQQDARSRCQVPSWHALVCFVGDGASFLFPWLHP